MNRWYDKLIPKEHQQKKNKYGATRTADGFPSLLERDVYSHLLWNEKAGVIKDVERQSCVRLVGKVKCKIDFKASFVDNGEPFWIEAKGVETQRWALIKKLWETHGPGPLHIYKRHANKRDVWLAQIIVPKKTPSYTKD